MDVLQLTVKLSLLLQAYKDATFTLAKAVYRTREGATDGNWYQIANSSNADLNGAWIKATDIQAATPAQPAVADNAIRVNLVDASGKTIKSFDYQKNNVKKGDGQFARLLPSF